jgi:hypothetical protein
LGATLFHLLAGRPPFLGATMAEVVRKVIDEEPPRLRALVPALSADHERGVSQCLQKSPERRYPSAQSQQIGQHVAQACHVSGTAEPQCRVERDLHHRPRGVQGFTPLAKGLPGEQQGDQRHPQQRKPTRQPPVHASHDRALLQHAREIVCQRLAWEALARTALALGDRSRAEEACSAGLRIDAGHVRSTPADVMHASTAVTTSTLSRMPRAPWPWCPACPRPTPVGASPSGSGRMRRCCGARRRMRCLRGQRTIWRVQPPHSPPRRER